MVQKDFEINKMMVYNLFLEIKNPLQTDYIVMKWICSLMYDIHTLCTRKLPCMIQKAFYKGLNLIHYDFL